MLDIARNEISSFNGLGGDGSGLTTVMNTLDQATDMFVKVNDSINKGKEGNNSSSDQSLNINTRNVGDDNKKKSSDSDIMDYLPWIAGGLGLILLITVMSNNKK